MGAGRPNKRDIVIQYIFAHPREYNISKIAAELGISRPTVYEYYDEARALLPKRHRNRKHTSGRKAEDYSPEELELTCSEKLFDPLHRKKFENFDVNDEGDIVPPDDDFED